VRAFELLAKVSPEGELELPKEALVVLPRGQTVRIIVLTTEPDDEDRDWARLTTEQFLAGYCEEDAIYDSVQVDGCIPPG